MTSLKWNSVLIASHWLHAPGVDAGISMQMSIQGFSADMGGIFSNFGTLIGHNSDVFASNFGILYTWIFPRILASQISQKFPLQFVEMKTTENSEIKPSRNAAPSPKLWKYLYAKLWCIQYFCWISAILYTGALQIHKFLLKNMIWSGFYLKSPAVHPCPIPGWVQPPHLLVFTKGTTQFLITSAEFYLFLITWDII